MDTEEKIDQLIERLADATVPAGVYNQYASGPQAGVPEPGAARRHNLALYLRQMAQREPETLLVGEAAGHRGCRLTGVPFTSEYILLHGVQAHNLFGHRAGYRLSPANGRPAKEPTATMVWEALDALQQPPLLWNALPFHPHQDGRQRSNRTPRRGDLAVGRQFLKLIQGLFPLTTIIAVGNKAAESLQRWNVAHHTVRHPSHGGKVDFTNGLHSLLA